MVLRKDDCWKVYIHIAPNGKRYVGITSQDRLYRRTGSNGEGYKSQQLFWRAIQKYGWDNFKHEIIAKNLTELEALKMEIGLIALYETTNPKYGYNISVGGNGVRGGSMQPVDREKMSKSISKALKGKPSKRKGKTITETHKQKSSQSLMGHKHSEYTKRKIGSKSVGRHRTQEEKVKISEAAKRNKGRHWYNNGIENRFVFEQPDGFVPGMLRGASNEK